MKETVKSLQTYFIVAALLTGYVHVKSLIEASTLDIVKVVGGIGLAMAIVFLAVGIGLRTLIVKAPGIVLLVIAAEALFSLGSTGAVLWILYDKTSGNLMEMIGWRPFLQVGVTLVICGYLFVNVKRLAKESRTGAAL